MCTEIFVLYIYRAINLLLSYKVICYIYFILFLGPTTVLSQGLKNIIDAMKAHNVELISVCLSGKV